jgi:hypothetical protein
MYIKEYDSKFINEKGQVKNSRFKTVVNTSKLLANKLPIPA